VDAVNRARIRIPPFWPAKVELWFRQLEAEFAIANISKDELKVGLVVGQLDQRNHVEYIICNPPAEGKYQKINEQLIKRFIGL
jgi:hypothetical protein